MLEGRTKPAHKALTCSVLCLPGSLQHALGQIITHPSLPISSQPCPSSICHNTFIRLWLQRSSKPSAPILSSPPDWKPGLNWMMFININTWHPVYSRAGWLPGAKEESEVMVLYLVFVPAAAMIYPPSHTHTSPIHAQVEQDFWLGYIQTQNEYLWSSHFMSDTTG